MLYQTSRRAAIQVGLSPRVGICIQGCSRTRAGVISPRFLPVLLSRLGDADHSRVLADVKAAERAASHGDA